MRPRSRRLLVCLLGLGICIAALSAFHAGFLRSNFALPPEVANRAPDTKVTLCTQVGEITLQMINTWLKPTCQCPPCELGPSSCSVLCAGPQRHAVPGELGLVLALCTRAVGGHVSVKSDCCTARSDARTLTISTCQQSQSSMRDIIMLWCLLSQYAYVVMNVQDGAM